jgi:hypothetical protein
VKSINGEKNTRKVVASLQDWGFSRKTHSGNILYLKWVKALVKIKLSRFVHFNVSKAYITNVDIFCIHV